MHNRRDTELMTLPEVSWYVDERKEILTKSWLFLKKTDTAIEHKDSFLSIVSPRYLIDVTDSIDVPLQLISRLECDLSFFMDKPAPYHIQQNHTNNMTFIIYA